MRQTHKAGEKCFVDYCGQSVPVIDAASGEIHQAQIFVGTLGTSNYTYAEATAGQTLPEWLASQSRMLEFLAVVLKSLCPTTLNPVSANPAAMTLI